MSKATSDAVVRNPSANEPFSAIIEKSLSRRLLMRGGLGAALGVATGMGLAACGGGGDDDGATGGGLKLGFESLPVSMTDACVVPAGYTATLLGPWGTPLSDKGAEWKADGTNTSDDLLHTTGMHHDGMHYFALNGSSSEGLLVLNHEYIDENALHPNGPTLADGKRPAEEVRKEINGHGVTVMHIRKEGKGQWEIVKNSKYNRRLTSATPMELAGPLAGTDWVRTPYSPDGTRVRGTNNNCGNGFTPWGTYITAEENWAFCFVNKGEIPAHQKRVGVGGTAGRYQWETAAGDASEVQGEFARFDLTATGASALDDWRNEINGFGYLVEIDPHDPAGMPVKHTGMGRFAHEGSAYGNPVAGQPLAFYSGDDSRFEYVYRFVTDAVWDPADARRTDRLAVGRKYLDKGTLYVARFNEDGTGDWLPLTPESKGKNGGTLGGQFGDIAAILVNTRGAADFVGATPMDRPEWTAVHPTNGDVYVTLTNNTSRKAEQGTNAANPRLNNANGHIVRWHDEAGANRFRWDIFMFGSPAAGAADVNRSGLTAANQLASPDGLNFDDRGILWIQTDNGIDGGRSNDVAKATNDQMLAVIPGALADRKGAAGPAIDAGNQADLRRFFVGPNEAEVTGMAFTPDHRTVFLNIQHPGNWPAYGTSDATRAPATGTQVRPRSSTVVIQRADGGPVGE